MRSVLFALLAVSALLSGFARGEEKKDPPPIKVLLICGGCCHDYTKQKDILKNGLQARAHCEVTIVQDPHNNTSTKIPLYENPEWYKGYDVILHDECFADVKEVPFVEGILKPQKEGIPAVNLHCAMHCYRTGTDMWFKYIGLQSSGHGPQKPIALNFVDKESPITAGMENWTTINEELYNNIKVFDTAKPLVKGTQEWESKDKEGNVKKNKSEVVVAWTNTYNEKTRVFSTTVGHNNDTVADPRYLDLVTRGLLWSCDKLNDTYLKKTSGK